MDSLEQRSNDSKRSLEEIQEGNVEQEADEDGFEIPKEHLRKALKRDKQLKPQALIQKNQSRVSIAEIRNVLMWVLSDSEGVMPKWCVVRNKNLVEGIAVIITPFLDRLSLYDLAGSGTGTSSEFPFFSHCIRGSLIPMSSVNASRYPSVCPVLSTFLNATVNSKSTSQPWVDRMSEDEGEMALSPPQSPSSTIASFLMSEENRRMNDFPEPLPGGRVPPGFVSTKGKLEKIIVFQRDTGLTTEAPSTLLSHSRDLAVLAADPDYENLVGIDCEMVETIIGKELARVSLVDYLGRVLYDSVVIPENEITDYLTEYSGITAKMIRECKTSFKTAQKKILEVINEQTILVGHALQNDLQCMKLLHDRVIDTSDLFPHSNGHPFKHSLIFLLQRVLRETLHREGGHDSVDDATASLRIAMKKIARGVNYSPLGLHSNKVQPLGELLDLKESQAVLHADIPLGQSTSYKTDRFIVNPSSEMAAKLRIHVLKDFQVACESNTSRKDALVQLDNSIRKIVSQMGENHVVIAFSGCGDVFALQRFERLAKLCQDEIKLDEVNKALQRAKDRAVSAYAIISAVGDIPLLARTL